VRPKCSNGRVTIANAKVTLSRELKPKRPRGFADGVGFANMGALERCRQSRIEVRPTALRHSHALGCAAVGGLGRTAVNIPRHVVVAIDSWNSGERRGESRRLGVGFEQYAASPGKKNFLVDVSCFVELIG